MLNLECGNSLAVLLGICVVINCNFVMQVMEEKLNETNVEAARVTKDGGFHLIKGSELEDIIKELDA